MSLQRPDCLVEASYLAVKSRRNRARFCMPFFMVGRDEEARDPPHVANERCGIRPTGVSYVFGFAFPDLSRYCRHQARRLLLQSQPTEVKVPH